MVPAVMVDQLDMQDRLDLARNMFSKACKMDSGDIEHQVNRMQSLVSSYGILEQISVLQSEMREIHTKLREMHELLG